MDNCLKQVSVPPLAVRVTRTACEWGAIALEPPKVESHGRGNFDGERDFCKKIVCDRGIRTVELGLGLLTAILFLWDLVL